ncbi:MAG: hypothetical protein ACTTJS_01780 [Wolinella sp.]
MEERRKELKAEIEELLNRLGGDEVIIDSRIIDILPLEELESTLASLKERAKSVNSEHLAWLIELADGK